jgi:hypothetical protein
MVLDSPRYFHLWQISATSNGQGFQSKQVPLALDYLQQQIANLDGSQQRTSQSQYFQSMLLNSFYRKDVNITIFDAARAGLCLRCYVSEPILRACKKIDYLFHGQGCFSYRDLLPFVLDDDGQALTVLDDGGKKQLILDPEGNTHPAAYTIFSVKVLQTFKPQLPSSMSLKNWAYLQTKQNPEIKQFLFEFGFQLVSDWALLNRVKPEQYERLSQREQYLVTAFHAVYRRDRRQQQKRSLRCRHPSHQQLLEMMNYLLQEQGISYTAAKQLLSDLKRVASQLRQYDFWCSREPLDVYDPMTQTYSLRGDLPVNTGVAAATEHSELLTFFDQQLRISLDEAIQRCICDRFTTLVNSRRYSAYAHVFIPGLLLYYCQGMPLRAVASQLGMTSWDQARRILNPGELLNQIRTLTVQSFLTRTLTKAQEMGLTQNTPDPAYLSTLMEQVEGFADTEIFLKASEELRAGQHRSMNSIFAQQMIKALEKYAQEINAEKEYDHA